ncbi:glycoside hydrolase family 16 [Physcia stellaris]|nr:glycoside hydrolase family 16 [Physcia stellaris]
MLSMLVAPSFAFYTLLYTTLARADCNCGYTVGSTLYTDLIESDFLHQQNITADTDWQGQDYTVSAELARGPYGKNASSDNIVANPLKSKYDWAGDGINGGDAGLQLIVGGGTPDKGGLIPMAELVTSRDDILYGSFRAGMKITKVNGTCGAFFWVRLDCISNALDMFANPFPQYWNNTQEIDMEFLSTQMNDSSSPVNLVLQSPQAAEQGFSAQNTDGFANKQLPYQPDEGFHEYRFDWSPTAVKFYADGVLLQTLAKSVPNSPGHITLSHWSNGDPAWSAGPPVADAILTVQYLKGYFNSSNPKRQEDWKSRCPSTTTVNATCAVPELKEAPNSNSSAHTFFFSQQKNMTGNQTVSGESAASSLGWTQAASTAVCIFTIISMMECFL